MFDRIVGGLAEGLGNGLPSLVVMFLFVLLFTKTTFAIPRKMSHGAIAFLLAWIAVAINYVIFHFDTQGPTNLAVIFGVPGLFSLIAIAVTAQILRGKRDQREQEPPSMD
jgi:uncharacterized membrane protein